MYCCVGDIIIVYKFFLSIYPDAVFITKAVFPVFCYPFGIGIFMT